MKPIRLEQAESSPGGPFLPRRHVDLVPIPEDLPQLVAQHAGSAEDQDAHACVPGTFRPAISTNNFS